MAETFFKIKKDSYINTRYIVMVDVSCGYTRIIDIFGNTKMTEENINTVMQRLGVPVVSKKVAIKRKN